MDNKRILFALVSLIGVLGLLFATYVVFQRNIDQVECATAKKNMTDDFQKILKARDAEILRLKTGPVSSAPLKNEKRVVSFGLYGNSPRYLIGALHNAELVKYILPGWVCRFYVDNTVPEETIKKLIDEGAEIVRNTDIRGGVAGMFWRFLVADDETVDRYIIRDADSRLSMRESMAVEEWIQSGKPFHIIRDHPNHNYNINGGLWGGVKGALDVKIATLIAQWSAKENYMADMNFLGQIIWPRVKDKHIAHDAYHCERWPNTRPFPTRRVNREIVGGVYDEEDRPRQGDADALKETPEACRKKPSWKLG